MYVCVVLKYITIVSFFVALIDNDFQLETEL